MQTLPARKPSRYNFNAKDYSFVKAFDLDNGDYGRHLIDGGPMVKGSPHKCAHCGSPIRYAAMMLHIPTQELVAIGESCLDGAFPLAPGTFHALRKATKDREAMDRRTNKRDLFFRRNPRLRPVVEMDAAERLRIYGEFVDDVIRKFERHGDLTPAQIAAVLKTVDHKAEWDERRAAEEALLSPAPTGRVTLTGTILSTKVTDGSYGLEYKMLVMADGNYKVWSTIPTLLIDSEAAKDGVYALKDRRIELTATLSPSNTSETFAIAKRPIAKLID